MDNIVQDFLIECRQHLDSLDRDLSESHSQASSEEQIEEMVRFVHTIRGTSGFLGFPHIERMTNAAERLLLQVRDQHVALAHTHKERLGAMTQAVRHMLDEIERNGCDGENDYPDLLAQLDQLAGVRHAVSK